MNHIAILKQPFFDKILSGEKTIESRWSMAKRTPYGIIKPGDTIYLKETGKPVTAVATAGKVIFYYLTTKPAKAILQEHAKALGVEDVPGFLASIAGKKYCTLIYLQGVKSIKPFEIDKKGYGNMAAWISIDSVEKIKKK
jgi:ASC-1-like (ASCH) protein